MKENAQLAVFRVKARDILQNYADRLKILVAENKALGVTTSALKTMRDVPTSRFAVEREAMVKLLKREAAGVINRVHMAASRGRGL